MSVIEPVMIKQVTVVYRCYKCIRPGCASSVFACGSQFVGSSLCVWVHLCTFCTIRQSGCQAESPKWILTRAQVAFPKTKKATQDSLTVPVSWMYVNMLLSVCLCVWYLYAVWYVVCNCQCLTIHHRAVFPHAFFTLFSHKPNFFKLLLFCWEKREKKTFFKITLTSVFFPHVERKHIEQTF